MRWGNALGLVMLRMTVAVGLMAGVAWSGDRPQWGEYGTRNNVSAEKNLPEWFDPGQVDPATGDVDLTTTRNVKWVARLGGRTHGTPVIAEGRVLVGTSNHVPRDPRITEDRGVLMCFDEKTGRFLWQLNVPKLHEYKWGDWDGIGLCASPAVENGRVYLVSNRCEIMCLDLAGMADGNDGPYKDEGRHMAGSGQPPLVPGPRDADILWLYDMVAELGVRPHNAANCSVLIHGDWLYVCTSNGVNAAHSAVTNPAAPTLIVVDKRTGRLVAVDDMNLGDNIIHGQWGSPALGLVNGKWQIFFGAGNGYVYGFEALDPASISDKPMKLKTIWKLNGHPLAQRQDHVPIEHRFRSSSYEVIANPVFYENRLYVPVTQDVFHGMPDGWLLCIDPTKRGDITRTGIVWSFDTKSTCSTVAIADGLVYLPNQRGKFYCLDARSGKLYWTMDLGPKVWGSPLVADGKVYIGAGGRRTLWILAHGREPKVLSQIRMPSPILNTPAAANGVLYVATWRHLYAIQGSEKNPKARIGHSGLSTREKEGP
ncbi:MAG TPA: pyrrolo-quinoline quinone [Planctomycetaceae bacterium]|nr:pyrrolo-quinoline quinone [Planctomycetaceae bacterium]